MEEKDPLSSRSKPLKVFYLKWNAMNYFKHNSEKFYIAWKCVKCLIKINDFYFLAVSLNQTLNDAPISYVTHFVPNQIQSTKVPMPKFYITFVFQIKLKYCFRLIQPRNALLHFRPRLPKYEKCFYCELITFHFMLTVI